MTTLNTNAAIFYSMDGYDTSRPVLMGRHAAGEGFLKGFVRHAHVDHVACYARSQKEYEEFCQRIEPFAQPGLQRKFYPMARMDTLAPVGALFLPGPSVGEYAWHRRFSSQRSVSLTGVTHTTATHRVMTAVTDCLSAPVQPWDAIICTSTSVVESLKTLLEHHASYLSDRLQADVSPDIRLPMIPLGVDQDLYAQSPATDRARVRLRETLGVDDDTAVVLFHGRLSWEDKHNPTAMLRAVAQCQTMTDKKVMLVLSGWFPAESQQEVMREAVSKLCPNVQVRLVDGRKPEIRSGIWFAADIFISLIDNIQETFGLTPIEAMAAGLPLVVSDWDGYKDTVQHGVQGFRVPTITPPPGYGEDLAMAHALHLENYQFYVGATAMATAVDIDHAARALHMLVEDPELRAKMGQAGRDRVKKVYDWSVIVAQYQELWGELAEVRATAAEVAPVKAGEPSDPRRPDPYKFFEGYPTTHLNSETTVEVRQSGAVALDKQLRTIKIVNYAERTQLPQDVAAQVLAYIEQAERVTVGDLLSKMTAGRHRQLYRSLGWWLKVGVLKLSRPVTLASDAD